MLFTTILLRVYSHKRSLLYTLSPIPFFSITFSFMKNSFFFYNYNKKHVQQMNQTLLFITYSIITLNQQYWISLWLEHCGFFEQKKSHQNTRKKIIILICSMNHVLQKKKRKIFFLFFPTFKEFVGQERRIYNKK